MLTTEQLFEEVIESINAEWRTAATSSSMTFQYCDGSDVTMLISKNAGRYRIQSSTFEALWLFTSELVKRIKTYYNQQDQAKIQQHRQEKGRARKVDDDENDLDEHVDQAPNVEPLSITFDEGLPYRSFFEVVDSHLEARLSVQAESEKLKNLSAQIRSIQKRLLVRFKERNPTPLNNIDTLFEESYRSMLETSKRLENQQAKLNQSSAALSCSVHLILLLVQIKHSLPDRDIDVLKEYLSPNVSDGDEQGWEETTEAAVNWLVRTNSKSVSAKDLVQVPSGSVEMPKDTSNLKRAIVTLNSRLQNGDVVLYKETKAKEKKKPQKK
ncbi:peptidyl-tRNA hydrolaseB1 [Acrasis kona]|uniref:Peptidyl-tRNA hydrolaseB1 n=1 Tax=Acrasis kona TaxID=1008807 RepID=A0AAW2YMS1_9EUKA